jgi:ligand-binding sensor domain-containing protein
VSMRFAGTVRLAAVLFFVLRGAGVAQTTHHAWSTENGLPQNSVHAIVQSRDGFLWIATEKGIARFDGVDFLSYSRETSPEFSDDDVRDMTESNDGRLLLSTAQMSFRFSGGRFTPIPPKRPRSRCTIPRTVCGHTTGMR